MRTTFLVLFLCAPALIGAEFAGLWKMTAQSPNGDMTFGLLLEKQGSGYAGEVRGGSNVFKLDKIAVDGDAIKFTIVHEIGPLPVELTMVDGQLQGAAMTPDGGTRIPMKGVKDAAAASAASDSGPAAGRWKLTAKTPDGSAVSYGLEIREQNGSLYGQAYNADGEGAPISGAKMEGSTLTFRVIVDEGAWEVSMTIEGDSAKGVFKTPDGMKGEFTGSRQK